MKKLIILLFISVLSITSYAQDINKELYNAVVAKDLNLVKELVDKKDADVNYIWKINDAFYIPTLLQAIMDNSTEIATYLIGKGANVNASDGFEMTCLMWAANNENVNLVKLLLQKGADKNAKTKEGMTALKAAEEKGSQEIINLLKTN